MTENCNGDNGRGHPGPPDGYFGWPPGYDVVKFLDDDGRSMSHEEWLAYLEEKRKDHRVIGSGTYEDPYRLPETSP